MATDIAARGIDIDELSHVINFDIPNIPETYVHRIGRTGRAGLDGVAISLCETEELSYLKEIQKLISLEIPVEVDHPFVSNGIDNVIPKQSIKKPNLRNTKAKKYSIQANTKSRGRKTKSRKIWTNNGRV